ncbi:collagen-like protein [Curtobacterium sp. MCBA15_004]|uniref:collagen-like protein n=1 Tax=Curtobacterium sp. MCBA15_004 TaxID=1898733 RepID=UPI0008DCC6BB|nr:collagen-like protein [Curtobacterium sp. MCBA15_004]WIA97611.1 collagen-like protein [Curtobacterium sp. MCBA15_004]
MRHRAHLATRVIVATLRARAVPILTGGLFLAAALVVALILFQNQASIDTLRGRTGQLTQQNRDLTEQLGQASGRYDRLFDEYRALFDESTQQGVTPSTVDPSDVPSKAVAGSPGAAGATGASGTDGDDGRDGRDGKDGEQGATGPTGATGATGASGETGATGTAGTDGATGPQGPAGPAGANGADGKDGRGVASIDCIATNAGTAFRFTYTDGTTTDVPGSCTPAPTESSTG